MTIPYVLLAKNFGPQSVYHAVAQLFAVGRGFETRPGLQLKNFWKTLVNATINLDVWIIDVWLYALEYELEYGSLNLIGVTWN